MLLLTYICCVPAALRWNSQLSQCAGESKRDGAGEGCGQRKGSHAEVRPLRTCRLSQAEIVYPSDVHTPLLPLKKQLDQFPVSFWTYFFNFVIFKRLITKLKDVDFHSFCLACLKHLNTLMTPEQFNLLLTILFLAFSLPFLTYGNQIQQ